MRPGDLLSWCVREATGVTPSQCDDCRIHIATMNTYGWWWCWRNRDMVTEWLIDAAGKFGFIVSAPTAYAIVVAGFLQFAQYRRTKGRK